MKTIYMQQEIVLFMNTSFAHRELSGNKSQGAGKPTRSAKEKLEEACWNGLLSDLLPEIASDSICVNHLNLWQISQGDSFLCVDLTNHPVKIDPEFSINPALFFENISGC
jgi:hypothetical protein